MLAKYPPRKCVVEFGSKDINGNVNDLFKKGTTYIGIDILEGPNVNVVADASTWVPPAELAIDCVLSLGMLEHTPLGQQLTANAYKILQPHGIYLAMAAHTWPIHSGIDGMPRLIGNEYYKNVSLEEMLSWMSSSFGIGNYGVTVSENDLYVWAEKGVHSYSK